MSEVYAFPAPTMLLYDWALVYSGLAIGVGAAFQLIGLTMERKTGGTDKEERLYTWTNFWLILSGVIHLWIEGQFVVNRSDSLIKTGLDLYAAADFRYGDYGGLMEAGTAAMEAITAIFVGPCCLAVAIAAAHDYPFRHPLQLLTCTCQLYGLGWFILQPLYSSTSSVGHFASDPFLFWVICVGMNAPWGIFPLILLVQSFWKLTSRMQDKTQRTRR